MTPVESFVPDVGDIVWLEFNPQAGHEQAGKRPALVLSPASYNSKSGLMVCCPITSQVKGYPFEVQVIIDDHPSVILADQIKSLDWQARAAVKRGEASPAVMSEVRGKIQALLGFN